MTKRRNTAFFCQECGYESAKWVGQCPACKSWNTMVEEPVRVTRAGSGMSVKGSSFGTAAGRTGAVSGAGTANRPVKLSQVEDVKEIRE